MTIGHNPRHILLAVIPCIALLLVVNYTFGARLYPDASHVVEQCWEDLEKGYANNADSGISIDHLYYPGTCDYTSPENYVSGVLFFLLLGSIASLVVAEIRKPSLTQLGLPHPRR